MTLKEIKDIQHYYLTSHLIQDQLIAQAYLRIINAFNNTDMFKEEHSEHVRISLLAEELRKSNINPMADRAYADSIIVYAGPVDFKRVLTGFKGKTKEEYINRLKLFKGIYDRAKEADIESQWSLLELAFENEAE